MSISDVPEGQPSWFELAPEGEPITLYSGLIALTTGTGKLELTGLVEFSWLPSPALTFRGGTSDADQVRVAMQTLLSQTGLLPNQELILSHVPSQKAKLTRAADSDDTYSTSGRLQRLQAGDLSLKATEVHFLVVNFPALYTAEFVRTGQSAYAGRTNLIGEGWSITLDARPDWREREEWLQERRGFAATHVGRLVATNGCGLSASEAADAFSVLRHGLSLATARWVVPILPVGLAADGEALWADWWSPLVDAWRGGLQLTDRMHPEQLIELVQRIDTAWADPLTREVVRRVTYFLMDAHDPQPIEMAVATLQAGLELLAWVLLVEDHKTVSRSAYRNRAAASNVSDMLGLLGIPATLPSELVELNAAAKRLHAATGPEVFTRMRNTVMHPRRAHISFSTEEWVEAWRLGLHYLELGLLGYLGYQGRYHDALRMPAHTGDVQAVPWAPADST